MDEYAIQMSAAESSSFLSGLYDWGIEVIKVIQKSANPALTAIVELITVMGTGYFYIPLILLIFWWIDEKRGFRMGLLIIISAWVNAFLKDLLQHPRPFHLEPSVGLAYEPTYGAPSGHAQFSFTFWVPTAVWISRIWNRKKSFLTEPVKQVIVWTATFFLILLIGYTRLYLGVHFPTDLFTGWFLAAIIVIIWFIAGPFLTKQLVSTGVRAQYICAAAIALLMNGLYPEDRSLPALFLGFCVGYTLMKRSFPFSSRAEINGKRPGAAVFALRALVGFAGMAVIYLALRLVFPGEGSLFAGLPLWGETSPLYEIFRFIRYGLVGFWASAGATYVFRRMGLAANAGAAEEGRSSPE